MEKERSWNPYLAGALSGLLIVVSVMATGMYFGASTTFVKLTGLIEGIISPGHVAGSEYFSRYAPEVDWQFMFVIGILLGSFVSALASGSFKIKTVPDMWRSRFGESASKRAVVAFLGGAVAMFGARLAGGCTSGHGLSGTLQLALSGFIVLASLFAGGIAVSRAIYGGKR